MGSSSTHSPPDFQDQQSATRNPCVLFGTWSQIPTPWMAVTGNPPRGFSPRRPTEICCWSALATNPWSTDQGPEIHRVPRIFTPILKHANVNMIIVYCIILYYIIFISILVVLVNCSLFSMMNVDWLSPTSLVAHMVVFRWWFPCRKIQKSRILF